MQLKHKNIFSHALRSALMFMAGFLIYDILINLEKFWNSINPDNTIFHFYLRHCFKFILIFLVDLLILYGLALSIGIE
jgi:hypothetical protein